MKTIKDQFDELNKAVIDAIIAGEFDVKKPERSSNFITIDIHGLTLSFHVPIVGYKHLSSFSSYECVNDIDLKMTVFDKKIIYDSLRDILDRHEQEALTNEVNELKRKLEALQTKIK